MQTLLDEILAETEHYYKGSFDGELNGFDMHQPFLTKELSVTPRPGQFYRIRRGDSLLNIAGQAYGVSSGGRRLAFAQYINAHPFNNKYLRKGRSSFVTKYFPQGIISFYPEFDCDATKLIGANGIVPKGSCFAVIRIPSRRYNYHSFLGKGRTKPQSEISSQNPEAFLGPTASKRRPLARVMDTTASVFRWACYLEFTYEDPDGGGQLEFFQPASGVLIGPRHVLTAAHATFGWITGSQGTPQKAAPIEIKVIPGFDGKNHPWGEFFASHRGNNKTVDQIIAKGWITQPEPSKPPKPQDWFFDYAVFRLSRESGSAKFKGETLGWWGTEGSVGTNRIKSDVTVHHCGYPDRSVGQFESSGGLVKIIKPHVLWHNIPSKAGMSGGPLWLKETSTSKVQLIAIQSVRAQIRGSKDPDSGNFAVLITPSVKQNIDNAKKLLG